MLKFFQAEWEENSQWRKAASPFHMPLRGDPAPYGSGLLSWICTDTRNKKRNEPMNDVRSRFVTVSYTNFLQSFCQVYGRLSVNVEAPFSVPEGLSSVEVRGFRRLPLATRPEPSELLQ